MKKDVDRVYELGADDVIFFLHFGKQYNHVPISAQKSIVKALKDAGADAVIGCQRSILPK